MDINTLRNSYQQIIIFDTGYTAWEGAKERNWSGSGEYREIVQIAAVKIDIARKTIIEDYSIMVKPAINPSLSEYFMSLTGIDQSIIDTQGKPFDSALNSFLTWTNGTTCFSYAGLHKPMADGVILIENCTLYGLSVAITDEQFKNIRPVFDAAGVPTSKYNSGKLHQYFNIKLVGQEHNAMHDVRSLTHSLFALY